MGNVDIKRLLMAFKACGIGVIVFGITAGLSCVPQDYGITRLCQIDDEIYALTFWNTYHLSIDEWIPASISSNSCIEDGEQQQLSAMRSVTTPYGNYRIEPGVGIYHDGHLIFDLKARTHDTFQYYFEGKGAYWLCPPIQAYTPGPFDLIYDFNTDAIYFAMGLEGTLKLSETGEWTWIDIGTYKQFQPNNPQMLSNLLSEEGILSLLMMVLVPVTLVTARTDLQYNVLRFIALGSSWLWWLLIANTPLARTFIYMLAPVTFIIAFALFVSLLPYVLDIQIIKFTLLTIMMFMLPFLMWSFQLIPNYLIASLVALLAVTIVLGYGWSLVWRQHRLLRKAKPKNAASSF